MAKKPMEILTEAMFYILLAFRDGEKCGTDVADYIEARTRGRVTLGPGTLYTILAKFEQERYIRQIQVEGRKRTYCITPEGIGALSAEIARMRLCLEDAKEEP